MLLPIVASPFQLPEQEQTSELRILSWNIYMLPMLADLSREVKRSDRYARAKEIAELLNASDYDILVFQEAFHGLARQRLKALLRKNYPYMYGPINPALWSYKMNSGIFIISKIPLKKLGNIQYKECTGIDCTTKKGAALFEGEWEGKPFQLLGTHLDSGSQAVKETQYQQIAQELLFPYAQSGVPQIICGDFNIHKNAKDGRYEKMLKSLDCLDSPSDSALKTTYQKYELILDYILYRPNQSNIKIVDKQVHSFKAQMKVLDKLNGTLSDHLALSISVRL